MRFLTGLAESLLWVGLEYFLIAKVFGNTENVNFGWGSFSGETCLQPPPSYSSCFMTAAVVLLSTPNGPAAT